MAAEAPTRFRGRLIPPQALVFVNMQILGADLRSGEKMPRNAPTHLAVARHHRPKWRLQHVTNSTTKASAGQLVGHAAATPLTELCHASRPTPYGQSPRLAAPAMQCTERDMQARSSTGFLCADLRVRGRRARPHSRLCFITPHFDADCAWLNLARASRSRDGRIPWMQEMRSSVFHGRANQVAHFQAASRWRSIPVSGYVRSRRDRPSWTGHASLAGWR